MPRMVRAVIGDRAYGRLHLKEVMCLLYFLYFCYNLYRNSGLPGTSSDALRDFYWEW